ncbi:MAG: response regulator, partial [Desulfobacterales bacterium]|nr:response regulator [Desulfobacterales bacterium]
VRDALERVKIGDFTHRIEECSGMEQTRLLVEGYNEMVSALQAQEAVRLRAMEAIRESEERYRGFFEDNLSGAFISKPDGELIAYNPAFARIFGFESAADVKEIGFNALYPDPASYSDFLDLLRRERRLEHYEGMMRGMDGATINTLENIIGVFDDHGDLMEIRGYLIDVTDRKQLEGQLRQAQKMESIGTLAGGIAHDFNNILTSILGYSELALFDLPGGHPALEKVKEILRAGERARELVKQILTFSRQGERSRRPVFMHLIVKEVYKMLRSSLPSTIDIRLDVTPSGKVLADPTSIHQVAMNLCTNAFQAMRESGGVLGVRLAPVTIAAGEAEKHAGLSPGPHVLLTVSDTGPGMDRTTLERIFDPYFTTKKKNEGTGLGLSVVHGIIKSLDGAINVVSAPGEGAVFDVYLPRTDVDEEDEIAFSRDVPGGRERILIVDDEKDVIRVEGEMLERLGYKTTACNSGVAALQTFRDDPFAFDLVITDFTMPTMTGDKLTVELLKIRPDIPVILCTGFSQAVNEKAALSIGVRKFIMKPITIEKIAIAIREALAPRASA